MCCYEGRYILCRHRWRPLWETKELTGSFKIKCVPEFTNLIWANLVLGLVGETLDDVRFTTYTPTFPSCMLCRLHYYQA